MTTASAARDADAALQTILKAVVVGSRVQDPSSRPGGEDETGAAFANAGALVPPYDPEALCLLVEHSNSLRQNVDAYATNIDGFGSCQRPGQVIALRPAKVIRRSRRVEPGRAGGSGRRSRAGQADPGDVVLSVSLEGLLLG